MVSLGFLALLAALCPLVWSGGCGAEEYCGLWCLAEHGEPGDSCHHLHHSGVCRHLTDSTQDVDCSKRTRDGQPCCVFSKQKQDEPCKCVQRRCHLDMWPKKEVPPECSKLKHAGAAPWVLLAAASATLVTLVAIFAYMKSKKNRTKMSTEKKIECDEEIENGRQASDEKEPERNEEQFLVDR